MSGKTVRTVSTWPWAIAAARASRVSIPGGKFVAILSLLRCNENALEFAELFEGGRAEFSPQTARFEAAKGHLQVDAAAGFDRDHADLHFAHHPQRPRQIACPDRTC